VQEGKTCSRSSVKLKAKARQKKRKEKGYQISNIEKWTQIFGFHCSERETGL